MELKELKENELVDSISVISYLNSINQEELNKKEFKVLNSRFITDGEISDKTDKEKILIDKYPLEDGYVIEDAAYMTKKRISFKNYSYVIFYQIVYKKNNNSNDNYLYIDVINMTAFLKDITDMKVLSQVRRIIKSIKKTIKSFNTTLSFSNKEYNDNLENSELNNISENVYQLKKF